MLDEKQINAQTQALFDSMHLKLDPRTKAADLTVAKQQMVEIAKALSFNSQVLIMDEPTAALTESEIEELFRIIRTTARQRRRHRLHLAPAGGTQADLRPHHRHARWPLCGHGATRQMSPIDRIISMMVGRTIFESAPEVPERPRADDCAGGQESQSRHRDQGRQFQAQEGRNSGLCRADGRRPHGSGTGGLRRRSDRFGRDLRRRQAGAHQEPDRCGGTWHRLSVGRPQALRAGAGHGRRSQHRAGVFKKFLDWLGAGQPDKHAHDVAALCRGALDQDAESAAAGQEPLRRQPAEGRHRQMADRRHEHPDL